MTINRKIYVLIRTTWRLKSINSEGLREKQNGLPKVQEDHLKKVISFRSEMER